MIVNKEKKDLLNALNYNFSKFVFLREKLAFIRSLPETEENINAYSATNAERVEVQKECERLHEEINRAGYAVACYPNMKRSIFEWIYIDKDYF